MQTVKITFRHVSWCCCSIDVTINIKCILYFSIGRKNAVKICFFSKIIEKKKPREKQNGGIINNRGQEFHFELKHLENLTCGHESRLTCTKVVIVRIFWSCEKDICKTT